MFKKYLLLLAAMLPCLLPLRAQLYIGVHGGVTLPTGFYGDSRMSDYEWMMIEGHQLRAGAGTGFSAGLDFGIPMPFLNDLSALITVDYMQSGPNRDVRNYYANHYLEEDGVVLPQYRNIPILLGARYSYPLGTFYDLYGEAQMGVNIRQITEFKYPSNSSTTFSYQYDNCYSMAFHLGAGIMIRDIVSVGAGVNLMGKGPLKGTSTVTKTFETPEGTKEASDSEPFVPEYTTIKPTMVYINLGVHLNPFKSYTRRVQEQ